MLCICILSDCSYSIEVALLETLIQLKSCRIHRTVKKQVCEKYRQAS